MKKIKNLLLSFIILLLLFPSVIYATSHYTYEHSNKMKASGKINWKNYELTTFNEALNKNK